MAPPEQKQIETAEVEHTGFAPEAPKPPKPDRNRHKLAPVQFAGKNIVLEDGSKKKFEELNEDEKKSLFEANEKGELKHGGMNDYNKVDKETFDYNKENTLRKIVDKSQHVSSFTSKGKITKENHQQIVKDAVASLKDHVSSYHKSLNSITSTLMEQHVDDWGVAVSEAVNDGSMGDMDSQEIYKFMKEDIDRIMFQEEESKPRSLGDHGIKHLANNAHNTVDMLTELQNSGLVIAGTDKKITGKDKLMALSIMANHDDGYAMGEAATTIPGTKKHKKFSGIIANEERDRYEKMFGKDGADAICGKDGKPGIIENHDKSDYDWEANPLQCSVALADVTALFGEDKVHDLFLRSPKAVGVCVAMRLLEEGWTKKPDEPKREDFKSDDEFKKNQDKFKADMDYYNSPEVQEKNKSLKGDFSKLKKKLHSIVDDSDLYEKRDKQALHNSVEGMSAGDFSSAQDVLGRYSGRLKGYKYDKDAKMMRVNMERSTEGNLVDSIFGDKVALDQVRKFEKDMPEKTDRKSVV